jgi:hypothetical protein
MNLTVGSQIDTNRGYEFRESDLTRSDFFYNTTQHYSDSSIQSWIWDGESRWVGESVTGDVALDINFDLHEE